MKLPSKGTIAEVYAFIKAHDACTFDILLTEFIFIGYETLNACVLALIEANYIKLTNDYILTTNTLTSLWIEFLKKKKVII